MPDDIGLDVTDKFQPRNPSAPLLTNRKGCPCSRRSLLIGPVVAGVILIIVLATTLSRSSAPVSTPTLSHAFRLVTFNDVYEISSRKPSSADPLLTRGGAAYVASYVRGVRAAQPHTLVLLAGDTLSPSLMSQFFNGSQMVHAHNAIGVDYACLGNHEFDMGMDVLAERLKESSFKWLNANVYESDNATLLPHTTPNAIVDYGFVKLGLFGLLYQAGYIDTGDAVIRDPMAAAVSQIAELQGRGANFIIALTHQFFKDSCKVAALPGMNLVVTGHDHVFQAGDCGAPAVVATSDWTDLWDVLVDFGRPGGHFANASDPNQPPLITLENVPVSNMLMSPDPTVALLVQDYEAQLNEQVKEVIGVSTLPLDVTANTLRQKESAVANFITDYLRLQWQPQGSPMEVALLNGGGFRSNMVYPAGNITVANILTIFPFSNVMPVVWLTGKELWSALEECFTRAEFPQISGINYVVDTARPVGSRVRNVTWSQGHVNFTPNTSVADDAWFLFTTNNFMLDLLSSWSELRANASRIVITDDEAPLLSELVIQAVKQNSPFSPTTDGRILRIGS